jgi:hypothetical protein
MFTLAINTNNQAFDDYASEELKRILIHIADCVDYGEVSGIVRDINGNKVGSWSIE